MTIRISASWSRCFRWALCLCLPLFVDRADAGLLVEASPHWQSMALRPVDTEPTPNYYGYGLGLAVGYSAAQVFDLALGTSYTPGRVHTAGISNENMVLIHYGGKMGFRFGKIVYLGLNGGRYIYSFIKQNSDYDVPGRWTGVGGGVSLGALYPITKIHFWQITVGLVHAVLTPERDDQSGSRQLDAFNVTIAYVLNTNDNFFSGGLFNDFVNSLTF